MSNYETLAALQKTLGDEGLKKALVQLLAASESKGSELKRVPVYEVLKDVNFPAIQRASQLTSTKAAASKKRFPVRAIKKLELPDFAALKLTVETESAHHKRASIESSLQQTIKLFIPVNAEANEKAAVYALMNTVFQAVKPDLMLQLEHVGQSQKPDGSLAIVTKEAEEWSLDFKLTCEHKPSWSVGKLSDRTLEDLLCFWDNLTQGLRASKDLRVLFHALW